MSDIDPNTSHNWTVIGDPKLILDGLYQRVERQEQDVKALHTALNSVLSLFVSQHGYDFNCVDAGLEALARNSERLPVTMAFEERIEAIRKESEQP